MDNKEKEMLREERDRQKAKLAESINVIDPEVEVRFQNIEDPSAPGKPSPPFEFVFQTPKGIILSFRQSRNADVQDTALRDGEVYTLPISVVNHLNSMKTPIYGHENKVDKITGGMQVVTKIVGYRNRCACVPVNIGGFSVVEPDKGKVRAGRQKKEESDKNNTEKTNKELSSLNNI